MRQRDFTLQIDNDPSTPLFRRVAAALQEAIRKGRLQPGDALPGTRILAEQVCINRRIVQASLEELQAQGWIVIEPMELQGDVHA